MFLQTYRLWFSSTPYIIVSENEFLQTLKRLFQSYSTSTTEVTLSIESSTKRELSMVILMAFSGQTSTHLPQPRH